MTLDLATGELIEVIVDGATDDELSGPLGVASAGAAVAAAADTDEDCSDEDGGLLVASYRSDVVSVVRNCGGVAPLQLSDKRLRGPVAIAHDEEDPGSLYVGAYEASAVLYFNVSDAGEEAALLRRVADRVMQCVKFTTGWGRGRSRPGRPAPALAAERPRKPSAARLGPRPPPALEHQEQSEYNHYDQRRDEEGLD